MILQGRGARPQCCLCSTIFVLISFLPSFIARDPSPIRRGRPRAGVNRLYSTAHPMEFLDGIPEPNSSPALSLSLSSLLCRAIPEGLCKGTKSRLLTRLVTKVTRPHGKQRREKSALPALGDVSLCGHWTQYHTSQHESTARSRHKSLRVAGDTHTLWHSVHAE